MLYIIQKLGRSVKIIVIKFLNDQTISLLVEKLLTKNNRSQTQEYTMK